MGKFSEFFLHPKLNDRPTLPTKEETTPTYYERNHLWLCPLAVTVMWALIIEMYKLIAEIYNLESAGSAPTIPLWIQPALLALGGLAGGIGTARTDTVSSDIVQSFVVVAGIVLLLLHLFV